MKLRNLFFGACAAVAFAACSNSDEVLTPEKQPVWDKDGKGYLAFSVSMPLDKATRANDQFDEGLPSEYKVNDVALLLFKGTTEANAVYQSFVDMKDIDFGDPAAGNVTLDKKYVAKIDGMELSTGEKVWALAVVNRNKVFDNENNKIGGVDMSGKTFGQLQDIIVNTTVNANGTGVDENAALWTTAGGILMLNAPLCNVQGSTTTTPTGAQVTILQNVTSSIFATENEARQGECSNIYVERAIAKVTVTHTAKTGTTKDDGANVLFTWDLQDWRLDHTNTKSYVVRNMSNFETTFEKKSHAAGSVYRMIGAATVAHRQGGVSAGGPDNVDRYRTYFAIDPNYNTTGTFNSAVSSSSFGSATPQYCAENVFNVEHQIWGQTTRVLVKATLTPGSGDSYYAHPGDEKFLSQETVKEMAYNKAIANFRERIKLFRDANILTGSITYASSTVTIDPINGVTVVLPTGNITLASSVTDAAIAAVGVTGVTNATELRTYLDAPAFQTQLIKGADMGVSHYRGGTTYYQVRIKHFGDDLTPWNNQTTPEFDGVETKQPSAGGISNAYPSGAHNECNYLGRYGVLRNNWYEINLSNIVKIGYASVDDLKLDGTGKIEPNTPDDHIEKEQWINAEVNILSWAKRFQQNNLGED